MGRLPPEAYITAPMVIAGLMQVMLNWKAEYNHGWDNTTRPYGPKESSDWLVRFDPECEPKDRHATKDEYHIGNYGPLAIKARMDRIIQLTQGGYNDVAV